MKKIFLILTGSIVLAVAIWFVIFKIFFYENEQPLQITAHYMRYACGDCYPQWKVEKAEQPLQKIIGKDIQVYFKEKPVEEYLSKKEKVELIEYSFSFEGKLKSTISGEYIFETNKYSYTKPIIIY